MRYAIGGLVIGFMLMASPNGLEAQDVTGEIELETRAFPRSPLFDGQRRNNVSLRLQPEVSFSWDRGRTAFLFEPFVRVDLSDERRSHFDVRELSLVRAWSALELRVGIRTVFWGVTESQHLVDVINQTDLVENLDGEDKLGQPMVNLAFIQPWGAVDVYVLPYFRERTFPGVNGRLRFPLIVDEANVVYESGAGRRHVDVALRWSHYIAGWDLGLSHFVGTNREPRLELGAGVDGESVLISHYDQMNQTGADVQYTTGSWLLKFEGITRDTRGKRFWALTTGAEYTLYSLLANTDVGLFAEYLWDSRDSVTTTPFDDDVAFGTRLAFNDTQSSELLAFAVIDRGGAGSFVSVEGSRRLGSSWTVAVESRGFFGVQSNDPLYALRRDGYVGVTLTRYF